MQGRSKHSELSPSRGGAGQVKDDKCRVETKCRPSPKKDRAFQGLFCFVFVFALLCFVLLIILCIYAQGQARQRAAIEESRGRRPAAIEESLKLTAAAEGRIEASASSPASGVEENGGCNLQNTFQVHTIVLIQIHIIQY